MAIRKLLETYFESREGVSRNKGLYSFVKPFLCESGIFPRTSELLDEPGRYLKFQEDLQALATLPKGMNLALSLMIEVNVAGGVLIASDLKKSLELRELFSTGEFILACGVSEPGWEGSLKNIKSVLDQNLKLNGTKSFVSNGGEANGLLWIVSHENKFPVYFIDLLTKQQNLISESVSTPFLASVTHSKFTAFDLPLGPSELVCTDYQHLGIELRLKELFSLVSLLLGYTATLVEDSESHLLRSEWENLQKWRDTVARKIQSNDFLKVLLDAFPFPIDTLLNQLKDFYQLTSKRDLNKINPDYAIFLWEDTFTKYLINKKSKHNLG